MNDALKTLLAENAVLIHNTLLVSAGICYEDAKNSSGDDKAALISYGDFRKELAAKILALLEEA